MCLALVWCFALSPRTARAADLRIDWSAPAECSSGNDLKARIVDLMGGAVHSDLRAIIEVTHDDSSYRAHVVMRGPSGYFERWLEDARCDVLRDSVALLIAVSLPGRVTPNTPSGLSLALSPEGRIASGSLPLVAAGFGGSIAIEPLASLRLAVHGAYFLPQSTTFDQTTIGAKFRSFAFGAGICRLWYIGPFAAGPCVGVAFHHLSASGFGGMTQLPGSASWWAPSLGLFGRAQLLPAFGINMSVEAMVPVSRPHFVFSDFGELHRVSAVAMQVSLGPEVRI
jgi:hypothetical protein